MFFDDEIINNWSNEGEFFFLSYQPLTGTGNVMEDIKSEASESPLLK